VHRELRRFTTQIESKGKHGKVSIENESQERRARAWTRDGGRRRTLSPFLLLMGQTSGLNLTPADEERKKGACARSAVVERVNEEEGKAGGGGRRTDLKLGDLLNRCLRLVVSVISVISVGEGEKGKGESEKSGNGELHGGKRRRGEGEGRKEGRKRNEVSSTSISLAGVSCGSVTKIEYLLYFYDRCYSSRKA